MTSSTGTQKSDTGAKQALNRRKKAAKAAVFTTVDMKAVISVGEPWYTSGVQKWKGAAPTLKQRPCLLYTSSSSTVGFRCAMTLVGEPEISPEGKPHFSVKKAKPFKANQQ